MSQRFDALTPEELSRDDRRVVVIDDDPTGTQTVSDVDILLAADRDGFHHFLAGNERALYVLSNNRALSRQDALAHLDQITCDLQQASSEAGQQVAPVLRGDSTLRGHVFAEVDRLQPPDGVTLFVPAFPEGGRVTRSGVQWIERTRGEYLAVVDTEFARDRVFGYTSRTLPEWVAEVGGGRQGIMVPLEVVREQGPTAICGTLLSAPAGAVVIPEAETRADLLIAARGLLAAERQGRSVTVRSASTFASIRAGLRPKDLRPCDYPSARILVACGSHTEASSRQLTALREHHGCSSVELSPEGADSDQHVTSALRTDLDRTGLGVLTTPRRYVASGSLERSLMLRLVAAVRQLRGSFDLVICKGGITSAEVARTSIGARTARVLGQVAPGVPLWRVDRGRGHSDALLVVVPGNVGHDSILADLVSGFRGASR